MSFVQRLTSNIGMRGMRHTRERERRRTAEQMGTYVGAVQEVSQLALQSDNLPFTVPDVTKLKFAIGPENRQPYITITDPGTPADWKNRLRDELGELPRCWGISDQPIDAGQLINLLVKYGIVGWQVARETKKQAAPDGR